MAVRMNEAVHLNIALINGYAVFLVLVEHDRMKSPWHVRGCEWNIRMGLVHFDCDYCGNCTGHDDVCTQFEPASI